MSSPEIAMNLLLLSKLKLDKIAQELRNEWIELIIVRGASL